MSWTVDKPVQVGAVTLAAIVENTISVQAFDLGFAGFAKRTPVLFLHIRDGQVTGVDMNGQSYERDEIETLYPDAIAQIDAQQSP